MKLLQYIQHRLPHKYAINAQQLGDDAVLAWTSLGWWDETTLSYPQACRQMADQLAQRIRLNAADRLLDLGCGQGASLQHWLGHYRVRRLEAVELQADCVRTIQQQSLAIDGIHVQSFLNLKQIVFQSAFDAIVCLDAAYHHPLNSFLSATGTVLHPGGRLGFHYLMLSEQWHSLNTLHRQKYTWLLRSADINIRNLATESQLNQILCQHAFTDIEIQDISAQVFGGFSAYISRLEHDFFHKNKGLDWIKIQMTAKLCAKLYRDGLIRYVQIAARLQ
ncbi:SAM-dependent methyltransferase [Acinetobacter sp. WZC-1]|uniref:SAM-dependent methyltransferase n=1 Tax=Acinetobacter sp. WZC-1 TaxID=3459034 RepID=UPI00403D9EEE